MIGEAELKARVGHRFAGGRTRIEPYQDLLLRDVVGAPPADGDLAHPLAAFVAALAAYDTGLEDVFALFGASSADGPMLGEWAVEACEPLRVGREYAVAARVVAAARRTGARIGVFDVVTVAVELVDPEGRCHAVVRPSYVFPRSPAGEPAGEPSVPRVREVPTEGGGGAVSAVGDPLPAWTVDAVDAEKMKIMAALLRDPNPIHLDPAEVRRLGLGDRVVNQGPVTVGYVQNMLSAWAGGEDRVRALALRLQANVFAGDRVVAGGRVTTLRGDGGARLADCEVWLDVVGGPRALHGTATVALGPATVEEAR